MSESAYSYCQAVASSSTTLHTSLTFFTTLHYSLLEQALSVYVYSVVCCPPLLSTFHNDNYEISISCRTEQVYLSHLLMPDAIMQPGATINSLLPQTNEIIHRQKS